MADDAAVFLVDAGQKAGRVDEGDDGQVVAVAQAHKSGNLVGGVDVDHAGHHRRLLRDDTDRVAVQAGQADQRIISKTGLHLQETAAVDDVLDHLVHRVGHTRVQRDDAVQHLVHASGVVFAILMRRVFDVVGGQITQHKPRQGHRILIGGGGEVRGAADREMDIRAAQALCVDHLAGDGFDHVRAGEEHIGGFLNHNQHVSEGRGVGRPTRARAHHYADLRHNARVLGVAAEDLSVSAQAVHGLLNARATRVDQADDGRAVANGHIHRAANFSAVHLAQRATQHGKVLCVNIHRPSVNRSIADNHAVTGGAIHGQAFVVAQGHRIGFQLLKRAGVEQLFQALAGCQLAFGMLLGDAVCAAALAYFFAPRAQFNNAGIYFWHMLLICYCSGGWVLWCFVVGRAKHGQQQNTPADQ